MFGSIRRAFRVVLTVSSSTEWVPITTERTEDLLVYLALSQVDERSTFRRTKRLSLLLQGDVNPFFRITRMPAPVQMKFSLGRPDVVASACQDSRIGKLTPTSLYIRESARHELSPVLRLYEGCARGYLGRVDGANVIKLYRIEPLVSYLGYPEFDKEAYPVLEFSIAVHLQTFRVRSRNYSSARNRPVLHRKELFVSPNHSQYNKWARLTRIRVAERPSVGLVRQSRPAAGQVKDKLTTYRVVGTTNRYAMCILHDDRSGNDRGQIN